jgi:hypothetical protein
MLKFLPNELFSNDIQVGPFKEGSFRRRFYPKELASEGEAASNVVFPKGVSFS